MAWSDIDEDLFAAVGGEKILQGFEGPPEWYFGWFPLNPLVDPAFEAEAVPLFSVEAKALQDSGAGRTVLLYEAALEVMGRHLDTGPQLIGDCVSWGFAGAVDLLACVEILAGEDETYTWDGRAATEAIYALSRKEFGRGSFWRDGSSSIWAADAVTRGGTLPRSLVGAYDKHRARNWGRKGLPDDLEPAAREHRVAQAALVRNFAEARDAIANGYPIAVGSDVGFMTVRDAEGFCTDHGSWSHCMKFIAAKDDARPGLLCMNSWGDGSPSGPAGAHAIPPGSFWVDASTCDRMLGQKGAFALAGFSGYRARPQFTERFAR